MIRSHRELEARYLDSARNGDIDWLADLESNDILDYFLEIIAEAETSSRDDRATLVAIRGWIEAAMREAFTKAEANGRDAIYPDDNNIHIFYDYPDRDRS